MSLLPPWLTTLLGTLPYPSYVVGGAVRDSLLGRVSKDIDIVLQTTASQVLAVAQTLAAHGASDLQAHAEFGTATLQLASGQQLDLAMARAETYPHPAALPQVRPATIRQDLARRDFSINAMACPLAAAADPPQRGDAFTIHSFIIDPFDGRRDLAARQLRILHPASFRDDPSRLLRGARLAGRLGFTLHETTQARLADAYTPTVLQHFSRARRKHELLLTLAEPTPLPALRLLAAWGALTHIFGITLKPSDWQALESLAADAPPASYLLLLLASQAEPAEWDWSAQLRKQVQHLQETRAHQQLSPQLLVRGIKDGNGLGSSALRAALATVSPTVAEQLTRLEARAATPQLQARDLLPYTADPRQLGNVMRMVAQARAEGGAHTREQEYALALQWLKDAGLYQD